MKVLLEYLKAAEAFAEELHQQCAVSRGVNTELALKAKLLVSSLALASAHCQLLEREKEG